MFYEINRQRARTTNNEPTQTDQAASKDTDINIIVNQFMKTGQAPGARNVMYGDFSELPTDLRSFIEQARTVNFLQSQLPKELQNIPTSQLLSLTPAQLKAMITPPSEPTTEQTK